MKFIHFSIPVFFLALLLFSASAMATSFTIDSHTQPWSTDINPSFNYGVNDGSAPVQVGAADGFAFNAEDVLTVEYSSGVVSWGGPDYYDANGDTTYEANDNPGSSSEYFPSRHMDDSSYPIYLVSLVGTFADDTGQIVADPFKIGNGPTDLTIPDGASYLQLGINDDIFWDNAGAFVVDITGPSGGPTEPVPEPASVLLLGTGLVMLGGHLRRKPKKI